MPKTGWGQGQQPALFLFSSSSQKPGLLCTCEGTWIISLDKNWNRSEKKSLPKIPRQKQAETLWSPSWISREEPRRVWCPWQPYLDIRKIQEPIEFFQRMTGDLNHVRCIAPSTERRTGSVPNTFVLFHHKIIPRTLQGNTNLPHYLVLLCYVTYTLNPDSIFL